MTTNNSTLTVAQLHDLFEALFFTPMGTTFSKDLQAPLEIMGLPLYARSGPGMAKSSIIYQFARRLRTGPKQKQIPFDSVTPTQIGEAGFGCVPVPRVSEDGTTVIDLPPLERFYRQFKEGPGLFFVDELTTAPRVLTNAYLSLTQLRTMGARQLSGRMRVMGAYNPASVAGGDELSTANINRVCMVDWPMPSAQDVVNHLSGRTSHAEDYINVEEYEESIAKRWNDEWNSVVARFAGFMYSQPSLQHVEPKPGTEAALNPWPSSRSWENLLRATHTARLLGKSEEVQSAIMQGCIGVSAATAYQTWLYDLHLPNVREVLDGTTTWNIPYQRVDVCYTFLTEAAAVLDETKGSRGGEKKVQAREAMLLKIADNIGDNGSADLASNFIGKLVHDRKMNGRDGIAELVQKYYKNVVEFANSIKK